MALLGGPHGHLGRRAALGDSSVVFESCSREADRVEHA